MSSYLVSQYLFKFYDVTDKKREKERDYFNPNFPERTKCICGALDLERLSNLPTGGPIVSDSQDFGTLGSCFFQGYI